MEKIVLTGLQPAAVALMTGNADIWHDGHSVNTLLLLH